MLYDANEQELFQLEKEKLRILRNAFYARQGYKFGSKDLKEFFSQFSWYNELIKCNEILEITNNDIVVSPKDRERVTLIKKIESNK